MRAPADANIDELKKKARRRLVGAIVLALAAAVFVPMLLESDERPLGDDVSVRIPPVDQGKFVNRLNSPQPAAPAAPGRTPANPASPAGAPAKPDAADRSDATQAKPTANSTDAARVDDSAPAVAASATPAAGNISDAAPAATAPANAAEQRAPKDATVASAPPPDAKPKPEPAAPAETRSPSNPVAAKSTAASAPAKSAHGGFVVQLAAFSDDKGANALANRLKRGGHPAFTESVSTARGTLWRVRVGPYASRDEANAARDKLKREGQSGIVTARTS